MRKFKVLFLVFISGLLGLVQMVYADISEGGFVLKKGDIIAQQKQNGTWSVIKVLAVDEWPDQTKTAHCLMYKPIGQKPMMSTINSLEVFAYHAPIDAASFANGWDKIGNEAPHEDELVGFIEYLKLTDFPRYAEFTRQDVKSLVKEANAYYQKAYNLGEQREHEEAISLYSKAIDIFPLFYEAIDNRGFTYMDLGRYEEALSDFESSLQVNPDGMVAYFSRGECLQKIGKYTEAAEVFKAGSLKFPDKKELFEQFYEKANGLKKMAN